MDMSKNLFLKLSYLSWNPYDFHKHLINTYVLNKRGSTAIFKRDTSKDKRDIDIIREHHKFLWEDEDTPKTWEERLAKKYYDKLFKEFCICDLSLYKESKFAMRWQTEQELITGKGQFICGNKVCHHKEELKTWEVNFAYKEQGEKKNALVKLRLCPKCSKKLNYSHKRMEIKRTKKKSSMIAGSEYGVHDKPEITPSEYNVLPSTSEELSTEAQKGEEIWKAPLEDVEEVSREDEFEKYLEHLLL